MPQDPSDATGDRILDAAIEVMLERGIAKSSMERIAAQAGVSHMTVYRRWPRKNLLLTALLERESQRLYQQVDTELADVDSPEERALCGFVAIFWHFYAHPLLRAEFDRQSVEVLSAFTLAATPIIDQAVDYLADRLPASEPTSSGRNARSLAEVLVRVTHSLLLSSGTTRPFADRDAVWTYGEQVLMPILRA